MYVNICTCACTHMALPVHTPALYYVRIHQSRRLTPIIFQDRRNVFTTGLAKLDHDDYAIKCVGGRQLHED